MDLVVLNHKMNLDYNELDSYISELDKISSSMELVVCPSFVNIPFFRNRSFSLGAQNCYYEESGAYTGEVSSKMLSSLGVKYVIVGHSERFKYFNETYENVNRRIKKVLEYGMVPIICVGEDRDSSDVLSEIGRQIEVSLEGVDPCDVVIAYEPRWAIGSGEIPSVDHVSSVFSMLDQKLRLLGFSFTLLYGGSVDVDNAHMYDDVSFLSGFLIGGMSLDSKKVVKFMKSFEVRQS